MRSKWANPEAAAAGLRREEREGGQGSGGKAYLRQLFERGYFISICDGKLSVVSFVDDEKYILAFIPDDKTGKDYSGDNPVLRDIRKYAAEWLEAYDLPRDHNITIVRGCSPVKPIEPDRLLEDIQQFPQARESIRACAVQYYENKQFRRDLRVDEPPLHPAFPKPIKIAIPPRLLLDGRNISTADPPRYPEGELQLCISSKPLHGQALSTWNRIDFHAGGVTVIGFKEIDQIPLEFPQYGKHLFGRCDVPLLTNPKDNYELPGRGALNDGPLSRALYGFIAQQANTILEQLARQAQSTFAVKRRKNLEKLNERLARWIESKLPDLSGLPETGPGEGTGKPTRKPPTKREHPPPTILKIHREKLAVCKGVSYELRALGYDAANRPVPPAKVVWKSQNSAVVAIHPETGIIEGKAPGLATITATNDSGLSANPAMVQVHEASEISIKNASPARVGSNRRLPLSVTVKTVSGQTIKDPIVSWRSSDTVVASVGQDGILIGGEVGEAEVIAYAERVVTSPLEVEVEKGAAGKPKGGGKGKPSIKLSGQNICPFDGSPVLLDPTDPLVHQRPYKPDYESNVFWINLQHPLADALLKEGEHTVQWRTYHFQRIVDVYAKLLLRKEFGDDQTLDVDTVLSEVDAKMTEVYAMAQQELYGVLFDEKIDFAAL